MSIHNRAFIISKIYIRWTIITKYKAKSQNLQMFLRDVMKLIKKLSKG